jgi:hypothetical protein
MSESEVDADSFERLLDSGQVGGGVTVDVVYEVDTSPRVAGVMGQGIEDPPFGEEV